MKEIIFNYLDGLLSIKERIDCLLVFPPFWDTSAPYLSIPVLASYLRSKQFKIESLDLNLAYVRHLLTIERLESAIIAAERGLTSWSSKNGTAYHKELFEQNLKTCQKVYEVEGSKILSFLDERNIITNNLLSARIFNRKYDWAFRIGWAPYFPMQFGTQGLDGTTICKTLSSLHRAVLHCNELPANDFLKIVAEFFSSKRITIIGISVAGPAQLIGAYIFAKHIKKVSPETFICIGGPQVSYMVPAIFSYPKAFAWVDAYISGEGEIPLATLCHVMKNGKSFLNVRGLYILKHNRVFFTGNFEDIPLEHIFPPDFTGFEPKQYIGNSDRLSLTFSRGCSWSKCSFCTQHVCYGKYREMDKKQIQCHIETIIQKYKVSQISVNDENLTHRRLRQLSEIFKNVNSKISWNGLARLDPNLTDKYLLRSLVESGCKMLCMGLESASQTILDFNCKGTKVREIQSILKSVHDSGIYILLFCVFGLPGETEYTAIQTIKFINEFKEFIDTLEIGVFRLERHSPIANNPEKYGITMDSISKDHCMPSLPVKNSQWIDCEKALIFRESLIASLLGSSACPIELAYLTGLQVFDHIAKRGIRSVRNELNRLASVSNQVIQYMKNDNEGFINWWNRIYKTIVCENSNSSFWLFGIPENSLFIGLDVETVRILELRSIGMSLESIIDLISRIKKSENSRLKAIQQVERVIQTIIYQRFIQETIEV